MDNANNFSACLENIIDMVIIEQNIFTGFTQDTSSINEIIYNLNRYINLTDQVEENCATSDYY